MGGRRRRRRRRRRVIQKEVYTFKNVFFKNC
jgi:hypothetical protein